MVLVAEKIPFRWITWSKDKSGRTSEVTNETSKSWTFPNMQEKRAKDVKKR